MPVLRRLASLLRVEDAVLLVLTAIALPLLDAWLAASGGSGGRDAVADPTVVAGATGLVGILGVIACVLTRGPDEPPPLASGSLTLQGWARFPLAAGVGIVALETLPGLGLDADPAVGIVFVATIAGALLHPRLAVVPVSWRRLMVLPMSILAAAAFERLVGRDLGVLAGDLLAGALDPAVTAFLPLVIGAIGAMYVMLVVAPRSIADPGSSGAAWLIRFGLLLAAVTVGAGLAPA
jgi:hypothetical protein